MNRKTEKILIGIGLGLLGIFGGYKLVKAYKKGIEELENQELEETQDLENAGVNTSKLKEEIKDDEKDFSKMLYTAVRFNSDIDLDLIELHGDVMRASKGSLDLIDSGEVIHVRQRIDTNKRGESRRKLDFLIEIKDWFKESYRGPKIGNYLTTFKEAAEKLSGEIIRFTEPAKHKLVGFVAISHDTPDGNDVVVEYKRLDPKVYSEYADDKHDGLTKFYEIEKTRFLSMGQSYTKEYGDWIYTNCPELDKNDQSTLVEDIILMYQISFPVRSNQPGELYGIDTNTGIKCIKYLTEDMIVGREGGKEHKYKHLIFHAPDPETGDPSLVWYYTVNDNENVVIDNDGVFYERDED